MKKILVLVISCLILLSGCNMSNTPSGRVESYLNNYISMSDSVIADIETKVNVEPLSNNNKLIYKDVLKRQYKNIKYEIEDEKIDGDLASVRVKMTVFDLHRAEKESLEFANANQNDFLKDDVFDDEKYNAYKLNKMLSTNDVVNYDIEFYLNKKDGEWIVQEPDRIVLEKIHGIYNYDIE